MSQWSSIGSILVVGSILNETGGAWLIIYSLAALAGRSSLLCEWMHQNIGYPSRDLPISKCAHGVPTGE